LTFFLSKNDGEKWPKIFFYSEIQRAPSEMPANLLICYLGQFSLSGQICLQLEAAILKGHAEFQI